MTPDEEANLRVVHRLVKAFNDRDRETFDSCYADPIVVHGQHGDVVLSHNEHWASVEETYRVFPDFHASLLGVMARGNRVFQYWVYSGTDDGVGMRGLSPTGNRAKWRAFSDYLFEGGRIVEATQIHDGLEMLLQLGVIDLPGESSSS